MFGAPRERLGLDPDNLVILSEQVKCAAFELPFRKSELAGDTPFAKAAHVESILDYLAGESGLLHAKDGTWYWMADAYPAQDVTLGGAGPDNVLILDSETGKAIGEIDRSASITSVHEGAIYQVEGETWKVERFDYENRRAYLKRVESDYFTEAETDTEVAVLRLERSARRERDEGGEDYSVWAGEVHVTTLATQYKKVRFYTRESVGAEDIHLPAEELDTQACVLTLSQASAHELALDQGDRGAAWAGVGKLLRQVAPLFLRCQPQDLGLSCQVRSKHFQRPALFFYDRVQGGVGLSELLFDGHREVLRAAHEVVANCACHSGCPVCVGPPEQVGALGKATAVAILAHLDCGLAPCALELELALAHESGA
jgi:DEAD/DEAH box helicase domain-containing protein